MDIRPILSHELIVTGRVGDSAASSRSGRSYERARSRSEQASTPARWTCAAMTWEGSRSTSAPVSWPPPARARSWSPAPVRDLVVGSDIALQDRGTHTLKGIGDQWQLGAAR